MHIISIKMLRQFWNRVVVLARYRFGRIYVQKVMTHREYDDWNKLYRKGKT